MNARTSSRLLLGSCVALGLSIAGAALDAQAPAGGRQGGAAQTAPPIPADAKVPGPTDVPGAVKGYAVPKTPWGDPDLQGIWPGIELVGVPMARDRALGARNWLTEEEFKQREARAEKQALQDSAEFDLETAGSTPGGDVGGAVSPPPHWLERGTPQRVASLIVDPVDGQQPPRVQGAPGGRQGGVPAPGATAA